MSVKAIHSDSSGLPLQHGMLFVSATTLAGSSPTDAYAVSVDDHMELTAVLLELQVSAGQRAELQRSALRLIRERIGERAPIYEVVAALRAFVALEAGTALGVTLLRFSQVEARVEILNAGMPPVLCALPDGHSSQHPALSPAIGRQFGDVHPYELCPLVWGSTFYVTSNGVARRAPAAGGPSSLFGAVDLAQRGAELAGLSPAELGDLLAVLLAGSGDSDASLCVIHSDPARRFRSAIV